MDTERSSSQNIGNHGLVSDDTINITSTQSKTGDIQHKGKEHPSSSGVGQFSQIKDRLSNKEYEGQNDGGARTRTPVPALPQLTRPRPECFFF